MFLECLIQGRLTNQNTEWPSASSNMGIIYCLPERGQDHQVWDNNNAMGTILLI